MHEDSVLLPDTNLRRVEWLTERELKVLTASALETVGDILHRVPRRHEDRIQSAPLASLVDGMNYSLRVHVYGTGWRFSYKRYFEVIVGEPHNPYGTRLYLRWFNMPYVAKLIAVGMELSVCGKVKVYGGKLTMANPEFEAMEEEDAGMRLVDAAMGNMNEASAMVGGTRECIHTGRIVPMYRSLSGMPPRRYREIVWKLLQVLSPDAKPPVYDVAPSYSYKQALIDLHFPATMDVNHKARMRFALSECFLQQFRVAWRRRQSEGTIGQVTAVTDGYVEELLNSLPFSLTPAQLRCVEEIRADMASPRQMNRLLQGDVGSGKTLVALCAMLLAVESGHVAAMLAPTQILAEQHYRNFCRLLRGSDVRVSLRTSAKAEDTDLVMEQSQDCSPRIIVGTHALLYKKNRPMGLGLAVIDEQHKFGVVQRETFINSGEHPDVLVMTATPIPRTLTLTLYGDLDVSVIDEMPAGRGEIVTAVRHPNHTKRMIEFMRSELKLGRQIYVVSPLIDDNETKERQSVTAQLEYWKAIFPDTPMGLLHGRMSAEEKEAAMAAFCANETHILIATTVVEVGVDVPNATIMVINDADSFGLSQLHQLRGRIGRGSHKSYCILLSKCKPGEPGREKLDVMCRTLNGFDIAEEDFRLRGPGDVLGTAQSGLSSVQFDEWLSDARLIHRANREASHILDVDPNLSWPVHLPLRKLVEMYHNQPVVG